MLVPSPGPYKTLRNCRPKVPSRPSRKPQANFPRYRTMDRAIALPHLVYGVAMRYSNAALAVLPHLVPLPAVNQASAAMRVQLNALGPKAIQYIVLYYLTQLRFHRYSSSNLCSPFPATDSTGSGKVRFRGMGIYLVNRSAGSTNGQRPTDNWPLPLPRSPRCLN